MSKRRSQQPIPEAVLKEAEEYSCNQVELIAIKSGVYYYSFRSIDEHGFDRPIGLPISCTWDGENVVTIIGF